MPEVGEQVVRELRIMGNKRKPRLCVWCGEAIERGTVYEYEVVNTKGGLMKNLFHTDCAEDCDDCVEESGEHEFEQGVAVRSFVRDRLTEKQESTKRGVTMNSRTEGVKGMEVKPYKGRIESWYIISGRCLGLIYDRQEPGKEEGRAIKTSQVVKLDVEAATLETKNSRYALGRPGEERIHE